MSYCLQQQLSISLPKIMLGIPTKFTHKHTLTVNILTAIFSYTHIHTHPLIHRHTHLHTYTHLYTHFNIHTKYTHIHSCTHLLTHIHTFIHISTPTRIHVLTYTLIFTNCPNHTIYDRHTQIRPNHTIYDRHTHICTHIYAFPHVHTHTRARNNFIQFSSNCNVKITTQIVSWVEICSN